MMFILVLLVSLCSCGSVLKAEKYSKLFLWASEGDATSMARFLQSSSTSNPALLSSTSNPALSSAQSADVPKLVYEDCLRLAIWNNQIDVAKLLVNHGLVDVSAYDYTLLKSAIRNGNFEMVKLLIKDSTPISLEMVQKAAEKGNTEILDLLLQKSLLNPKFELMGNNFKALQLALDGSHLEAAQRLLSDKRLTTTTNLFGENGQFKYTNNPTLLNALFDWSISIDHPSDLSLLFLKDSQTTPQNDALVKASEKGRVNLVKALLKDTRVDPSANNNQAYKAALEARKQKVDEFVKILRHQDGLLHDVVPIAIGHEYTQVLDLLHDDVRVQKLL